MSTKPAFARYPLYPSNDFAAGDIIISYGEKADEVIGRFDDVRERVRRHRARSRSTTTSS